MYFEERICTFTKYLFNFEIQIKLNVWAKKNLATNARIQKKNEKMIPKNSRVEKHFFRNGLIMLLMQPKCTS